MPITVFDLGTVSSTGGSSVITMSGINVPSGGFIYTWSFEKNVGSTIGSVTDSVNNSYLGVTVENPNGIGANGVCRAAYTFSGTPIFNGSITRTKSTTSTPIAMGAFYALGVLVNSDVNLDPIDGNTFNDAIGSNNNPKVQSGANFRFQFPNELVVANTMWVPDTGDTFTQSGGLQWAAPPTVFISTALGIGMAGGWTSNPSIATTLYNPFLNNARPWASWIQAFFPFGGTGHDSTTLYGIGNY